MAKDIRSLRNVASLKGEHVKTIGKTLLVFIAVFVLSIFYLMYNKFGDIGTALSCSLILAFAVSAAWMASTAFRCALLVAALMSFSPTGLVFWYVAVSWILTLKAQHNIIENFKSMNAYAKCVWPECIQQENAEGIMVVDSSWHSKINMTIHYALLIPVLLVMMHSFYYVFTFKVEATQTNAEILSDAGGGGTNLASRLRVHSEKVAFVVCGTMFGVTMTLFYATGLLETCFLSTLWNASSSCEFRASSVTLVEVFGFLLYGFAILPLVQLSPRINKLRDAVALSYHQTEKLPHAASSKTPA